MAYRKSHCQRGHEMTEENVETTRAGRRSCMVCNQARKKLWAERNRLKARMRKYGASVELYDDILTFQNGKCAICVEDLPLVVDHDHKTGCIRGLLCDDCNWFLGQIESHMDKLVTAVTYLQQRGLVESYPVKLAPEVVSAWEKYKHFNVQNCPEAPKDAYSKRGMARIQRGNPRQWVIPCILVPPLV